MQDMENEHQAEHYCGVLSQRRLYWATDGGWYFDHDDGTKGTPINFCPFCGEKLQS